MQLQQLGSCGSRLDWTGVNQHSQPGGANTSVASANAGSSQVTRFVERESATLQIRTAEGDLVTLRLREKSVVSLSGAPDQSGTGASAGTSVTAVSRGRLQVDVTGNLSDAELKAIGDVLSQVDALATKFFSGDVQGAFSAAASVASDPAQIAGFSLQLSYSSQLFQRVGGTQAITAPVTGAAAQPTQTAEAPDPSTPVPADTQAKGTAASSPSPTDPTSSSSADSPPAASTASPRQTITDFLQDVLSKLGATSQSSSLSISLRWKLEVLAQSLPTYAPTQTAATSPATSLAANTLSQLSA